MELGRPLQCADRHIPDSASYPQETATDKNTQSQFFCLLFSMSALKLWHLEAASRRFPKPSSHGKAAGLNKYQGRHNL